MTDSPADRMDELASLRAALVQLDRRVRNIEAALAAGIPLDAEATSTEPAADAAVRRESGASFTNGVAFAGRSLLVMGGAFLLRALTEGEFLSRTMGVNLGLIYALIWIGLLARSRRANLSAVFHGLTAASVAYPLVWETTVRFHLMPAAAAAGALVVLTGAGLFAAWRSGTRLVGWTFMLAALATSLGLLVATRAVELMSAFLILLGVATLVLSLGRGWTFQRWPAAIGADFAVLFGVYLVTAPGGTPEAYGNVSPGLVQLLALALAAVYLGAFAIQTLVRRRVATAFTAVQSAAVLIIGFGGAVRIARLTETHAWLFGLVAVALSMTAYVLAFTFVDRRLKVRRNFYYFAWLALAALLIGTRVLTGGIALTFLLVALIAASAFLGGTYNRATLRVHSAVYGVVAGMQSGLLAGAVHAFVVPAGRPWHPLTPGALVSAAVSGAAFLFLVRTQREERAPWLRLLPRFFLALLFVAGAGAVLAHVLIGLATDIPPAADPARLAGVRTVILAGSAVVLALLGRRGRPAELTWFVYPLIIAGAVKLLGEDFRRANATMLFIALACYGAALIVAARAGRIRLSTE